MACRGCRKSKWTRTCDVVKYQKHSIGQWRRAIRQQSRSFQMIQIIGNLLILYQFVFLSFDILSDSCLERKFLLTRRSFPIFLLYSQKKVQAGVPGSCADICRKYVHEVLFSFSIMRCCSRGSTMHLIHPQTRHHR